MSTGQAGPSTSANLLGFHGKRLGPNGREPGLSDWCDYRGCAARAGTYIPAGPLNLSLREALFGYEQSECYDGWAANPQFYGLCNTHYRIVKRRDGITLGYRKSRGKLRAYVKEEHF